MKSLKNLNFEKIRNVGIRVDFNVTNDKNFRIKDKKRLAQEIINELNNPSPIKNQIDLDLERFHMKNIVKKYNLLFKELTKPTI